MEISPENYHSHLLERVLDLLWSQWTALGTYTSSPPYTSAVIDPEALVCTTAWFSRYSPRLLDEAMDWLCANDSLVSIDRLKSIAGLLSSETRAVIGAILDYLWEVQGKTKFKAKSSRWKKERSNRKEVLFRSWPALAQPGGSNSDEVFLRWGFERGPVMLRGMSSGPDTDNVANLRFVLRDLFGLGVRAEVATYLITIGRGNSSQVARAVNQNQRAVYAVLDDFARGGFASKRESGREIVFTADKTRWSCFVELKGEARFVQWVHVFSALQEILVDRIENEKAYGSLYLMSSRLREISPGVTRKLANAGTAPEVPDPQKHPGEEFNPSFMGYIDTVVDELFHG